MAPPEGSAATTNVHHLPGHSRTQAVAGLCGLVAFVTFNVGWIAGDIAPPRAFSPANDDISYLGALTASEPWLYNQLAANVSGVLVIALGIGLWRALDPSRLGRA